MYSFKIGAMLGVLLAADSVHQVVGQGGRGGNARGGNARGGNAKGGNARGGNVKGGNNANGSGGASQRKQAIMTRVNEPVLCDLVTVEPMMINASEPEPETMFCMMDEDYESDGINGILYKINTTAFEPGFFDDLQLDGTDSLSIASAEVDLAENHGGGIIGRAVGGAAPVKQRGMGNGGKPRSHNNKGKNGGLGKTSNSRQLSPRLGVSDLLVLYAVPQDVENRKTIDQYRNDIFGIASDGAVQDPVNVITQTEACSRGKLKYVPASVDNCDEIVNGMMNVPIANNVTGIESGTVVNWVQAKAQEILKAECGSDNTDVYSDFTQVMVIAPDAANWKGAAAWAYVPGYLSAFRDNYADRMGVQLHEFGHNLGMHHSGYGTASYADHSCMMGNPSYGYDGPVICFNAAKSWETGWYNEDSKTVIPSILGESFQLVGVADWVTNSYTSGTHKVVLRILDETIGDNLSYHVIYNRAKGPNAGVTFAKDKVTISTGRLGKTSWHQAALVTGQVFRKDQYNNSEQTLVVKVCEMPMGTEDNMPDTARVLIYLDDGTDTDKCVDATPPPTPGSTTQSPTTKSPTPSPVAATPQPTPGSTTQSPTTKSPTPSPVAATPQPTPGSTTQGPTTKSPTNEPTEAPTTKPTPSPSESPVVSPTTPPPTKIPTVSPTPPPTTPPSLKPTRVASDECLHGSFILEIEGACTSESVLQAYSDQIYYATGATSSSCSSSAEDDLNLKLIAAGFSDASKLCDRMYRTQDKVPFTSAANRGTDMNFEKMFFNGRTDWQEEIETIYETYDKSATSNLKEDAEQVKAFYEGVARGRRVEWPGVLPNFQSSVKDADELATCTTNAAMCCWPKDRQANDNNGNCAKAYDENCVDNDPADNTNLCFVDLERGNTSTGLDFTGPIVYPDDNNQGEGSIHCHGLAWSNDVNDHTARYKSNNLFFVSMYDHMYQRGYVKNVPGAPMCGCVEQMPTVSRSDCTQIDLTETFTVTYNAGDGNFDIKLTNVRIDFNACQGINNRNNDLWAYIAQLYKQKDITKEQFSEAGRIITDTNCREATYQELNKHSLTPGYDHDVNEWTKVAGRESMYSTDPYGNRAFKHSLVPSTNDPGNTHYGIIYRACESCVSTHKKIFYRRLTTVPDELNLQDNILYSSSKVTGNVWDVDFSLHSTYEDALNNKNPWKCPGDSFSYSNTFYGRCSPDGTRVDNQRSRFNSDSDKNHVAYFVNKPEEQVLEILPSNLIKGGPYASGIALKDLNDGTIYMTGSGYINGRNDQFNYLSKAVNGDHTVIVHVGSMSTRQYRSWSKAGILFRSGLETNAAFYGLFLTRGNGLCVQGRLNEGHYVQGWGCSQAGIKEAWIKVEKRLDRFSSFIGTQQTEGGLITWTEIHSGEIAAIKEASHQVGLGVSNSGSVVQEVLFTGYVVDEFFFPTMAPTLSASPTMGYISFDSATASQSTTCYGGNAQRAIDGNTNYAYSGGSVTHTCSNDGNWWQVDLGREAVIGVVTVYNRQDCCESRIDGATIQVLEGDNVVSAQSFNGAHAVYSFDFEGVVGQVIKVSKPKGVISIAEVKVTGNMM